MDKSLEALISKYEKHLRSGERNLEEFRKMMDESSRQIFLQIHLIKVWKIVLNDLESISDKERHESAK